MSIVSKSPFSHHTGHDQQDALLVCSEMPYSELKAKIFAIFTWTVRTLPLSYEKMSLCWLILYKHEQMKLILYKSTVAIAFFYFSSKIPSETLAANIICIKC